MPLKVVDVSVRRPSAAIHGFELQADVYMYIRCTFSPVNWLNWGRFLLVLLISVSLWHLIYYCFTDRHWRTSVRETSISTPTQGT